MYPKVSIVILNWNGWKDTIECLKSLYQIEYPNYDIILVDNASSDDSIEKIRQNLIKSDFNGNNLENNLIKIFEYTKKESEKITEPEDYSKLSPDKRLILIKNDKNDGFAEGNNVGIRSALKAFQPKYILLLNNDTVVTKNFLNELVESSEGNENIGICGPKVLYYGKPNIINSAGNRIIWHLGAGVNTGMGEIDKGQYKQTSDVDYLIGACILIKSSLIKECGLLDNQLFLLFEEADFCLRAKRAKYNLLFYPKSVIYHKEGISGELSPLKLYYMYRNRLIILKKHQRPVKVLIYSLNISLRTLVITFYYTLKGDTKYSKYIIKGYLDGLRYFFRKNCDLRENEAIKIINGK